MVKRRQPRSPDLPERAPSGASAREQRLLERVQILQHELRVCQEETRAQSALLLENRRELERSRDRYADLYDFAPVGYATLDPSGCIEEINLTGATLLRVERALLLGTPLLVHVAPADGRKLLDHLREARRGEGVTTCEIGLLAGGVTVPARLSSRPVGSQDETRSLRTMILDLRDRRQVESQLEVANQALAERSRVLEQQTRVLRRLRRQLVDAQEAERRRIAALLHDEIQQSLFAIRLKLSLLGGLGDTSEIESLLDKTVATCRALSAELNPPALHGRNLMASLAWLIQQMRLAHGLTVTLRAQTAEEPAEEERIVVYHAVRELLFNVVKHADTDRAVVEVSGDTEQLVIQVRDCGRGIDGSLPADSPAHMGLANVGENVEALGGSVELSSTPGRGTSVRVALPLVRARPEMPRKSSRPPPKPTPPAGLGAAPRRDPDAAGPRVKPRAATRRPSPPQRRSR